MGRTIKHTKLIDGCHRSPKRIMQEKRTNVASQEEGVKTRSKRSNRNLPDSRDDIPIDNSKCLTHSFPEYSKKIKYRSWKARGKGRKQYNRKGNVIAIYRRGEGTTIESENINEKKSK